MAALALWAGICYICYLHSPYTPAAAKRLYLRNRADFNAVAVYLLDQAESDRFFLSNRDQWPEAVFDELGTILDACGARTGVPHVEKTTLSGHPALLFYLYSGPERDSGDGGPAYDTQYLAYLPGAQPAFANSYTEEVFSLAENWYLCNEVEF